MSVWDPSWALASLQPLDELSPVRYSLRDELLRGNWPRRAVEDGAFTQVGLDALVREAAGKPPFDSWGCLDGDGGRVGVFGVEIPGASRPRLVVFTEHGHLVGLKS